MKAKPEIRAASIIAIFVAAPIYGAAATALLLVVTWPADIESIQVAPITYFVSVFAALYVCVAVLWRFALQTLIDGDRLAAYRLLTAHRTPTSLTRHAWVGMNLVIGYAAAGMVFVVIAATGKPIVYVDLANGIAMTVVTLVLIGALIETGRFIWRAATGRGDAWRLTRGSSEPESPPSSPWRAQAVWQRSPSGEVLAWVDIRAANGLAFDESLRAVHKCEVVGSGRYGWRLFCAVPGFCLWHVARVDPYLPDSPPPLEAAPSVLASLFALVWVAIALSVINGDFAVAAGWILVAGLGSLAFRRPWQRANGIGVGQ